jgi:hypothetical protein
MEMLNVNASTVVMHYLHDVHVMNAYTSICLSRSDVEIRIRIVIKFGLDVMSLGVPKLIMFIIIQSIIPKWQTNELVMWAS